MIDTYCDSMVEMIGFGQESGGRPMKILRKTSQAVYARLEDRDRQFSLLGMNYAEGSVLVFDPSASLSLGCEMLVAPNMAAAENALKSATPPPTA